MQWPARWLSGSAQVGIGEADIVKSGHVWAHVATCHTMTSMAPIMQAITVRQGRLLRLI